jgi:hypothetical protein
VAGSCEHSNESLVSIKGREFKQLSFSQRIVVHGVTELVSKQ